MSGVRTRLIRLAWLVLFVLVCLVLWVIASAGMTIRSIAAPSESELLSLSLTRIEKDWDITVDKACVPVEQYELTDPAHGTLLTLTCSREVSDQPVPGVTIPDHYDATLGGQIASVLNRADPHGSFPRMFARVPAAYIPAAGMTTEGGAAQDDPYDWDTGLYVTFDARSHRLSLFDYSGGYVIAPSDRRGP